MEAAEVSGVEFPISEEHPSFKKMVYKKQVGLMKHSYFIEVNWQLLVSARL